MLPTGVVLTRLLASDDSEWTSMNEPQSTTTSSTPEKPAKRRGSGFWWLFGFVLLAVILVNEVPRQIRAWKLATALEAREAGDKARAKKLLDELLEKNPRTDEYRFLQYEWNKEDGEYEAALMFLQDELAAEKEGSGRYGLLISERSRMYQHLGRHQDAIADCQELVRLNEKIGSPSRQNALNGVAYARALAGVDLDAALADAETAVSIARAGLRDAEETLQAAVKAKKNVFEAGELVTLHRSSVMAVVDTRGLVRFKQGDFAGAQEDFDEAVEKLQQVREFMHDHQKQYSTHERDYKTFAKKQKNLDHNDAVIYYHRSLNLKALGRDEDAVRDWKRATELLGREPGDDLF